MSTTRSDFLASIRDTAIEAVGGLKTEIIEALQSSEECPSDIEMEVYDYITENASNFFIYSRTVIDYVGEMDLWHEDVEEGGASLVDSAFCLCARHFEDSAIEIANDLISELWEIDVEDILDELVEEAESSDSDFDQSDLEQSVIDNAISDAVDEIL